VINEAKILHISMWPGPPFSGANINCYNFLKRLTPNHRARFIILDPSDSGRAITGESLDKLGIKNEGVETVNFGPIALIDRIEALFQNEIPYVYFREKSVGKQLREAAERILHDWRPQIIVVWAWHLAGILRSVTGARKILYACDSVSLANFNQGRNSRNPFRKAYHRLIMNRCRRFEQTVLPEYDEVIFISEEDAKYARLPESVSVSVICNGVEPADSADFNRPTNERPMITFHGFLSFLPNEESVKFLVNRVGTRLEEALGPNGFEIKIMGQGKTRAQKRMAEKHSWLRFPGYVDDVARALSKGSVYVVPLTMGAGVNNKVLDAMSSGLPVIGTRQAFSGLKVVSGVHCLISELDEIPDKTLELIRDPDRRQRIGAAAREWTIEHADWHVQALLFNDILRRQISPAGENG
jgi:glycosyltransferase involved in cell wall biosynthesis